MTPIRTSIDKLPSGRWRARYLDPTTQKWKSFGTFALRREAREALDTEVARISTVTVQSPDVTFHEFATTRFFPFEDLAPSTAFYQPLTYKNYVRPRWGDVLLRDITIEAVETWARVELPATHLVRTPDRLVGDSTRRQAYWMFHKIMAKAVERDYVTKSPLPRRSGMKSTQPRKPERVLTPDQVELLAGAAGSWSPAIFAMAYGGFRIGEAFALRLDDLDFARCQVIVDEKAIELDGDLTYDLDLKRSRSQRRVPMPTLVMEMLAALTMDHDSTQLVFGDVRPADWRARVFTKAVKKSGLPHMTPHDLRHTAASIWFHEGFSLVEVARFLGDSLAVAEQTYIHIFEGGRPERMQALDDRIRQARPDKSNVVPLRRAK